MTTMRLRTILPLPVSLVLLTALSPLPAEGQGFELLEATVDDIREALDDGRLTCIELVQGYLDRIERFDRQGPAIHAVQTVNPEALERARELDRAHSADGPVGPLHCIPVLVKDQVEVAGMPTTYGSALFEDFDSGRDATIVIRMRDAGAIILGKATMGEFAQGYAGSAFGLCRNVYALDRNPSGSSCGSGIAAAANFATVTIGEDTGGSIRGPAAHTSTVGLRPTLPLVSRFGMFLGSPTRDTLGPITRTVRDAAILMDVIAGYDPNDPITARSVGNIPGSYTAFLREDALDGARLGVIRSPMDSSTDPDSEDYARVRAVVDRAVADLEGQGAEIVDPVEIEGLAELLGETGSNHETEASVNAYLAELSNPPVRSLAEIAVSDELTARRRYDHVSALNLSTADPEFREAEAAREELRIRVLGVMADHDLDALVYSTFDHAPALIPADVLTNPDAPDEYGKGSNRNPESGARIPGAHGPGRLHHRAAPRWHRASRPALCGGDPVRPRIRIRAGHGAPSATGADPGSLGVTPRGRPSCHGVPGQPGLAESARCRRSAIRDRGCTFGLGAWFHRLIGSGGASWLDPATASEPARVSAIFIGPRREATLEEPSPPPPGESVGRRPPPRRPNCGKPVLAARAS